MNGIRLGHIGRGDNRTYTFLDILTTHEFDEIISATEVLNKYKFSKNLFSVFDMNYKEFTEYPPLILDRLMTNDTDNEGMDSFLNCNRLFINFLSSFRVYIDYLGTYLKRKYGHTSEHVRSFERCISHFFDEVFAYRFMYKLRNYAQHCGFPIGTINYSKSLDDKTGDIIVILKVLFNRDELLDNFDSWTIVKKELEKMPDTFDVMSIAHILHCCISDLARFLEDIDRPSLLASKQILNQIIERVNVPEEIVCVFYDFKMSKPNSYENSSFSTLILNEYLNF